MRKPKSAMDEASDNKSYAKARKHYLERIGAIDCVLCSYHLGENAKHKYQRSWKKSRKTKWRIDVIAS